MAKSKKRRFSGRLKFKDAETAVGKEKIIFSEPGKPPDKPNKDPPAKKPADKPKPDVNKPTSKPNGKEPAAKSKDNKRNSQI